jgi:hypothetical protein
VITYSDALLLFATSSSREEGSSNAWLKKLPSPPANRSERLCTQRGAAVDCAASAHSRNSELLRPPVSSSPGASVNITDVTPLPSCGENCTHAHQAN